MTSKVLFDGFKEAWPVFHVFMPRDKFSGASGGFGFVRLKQNGMLAVQRLHGRLVGSRDIGVQKAKILK